MTKASNKGLRQNVWLLVPVLLIMAGAVASFFILKSPVKSSVQLPECTGELSTDFNCYRTRLRTLVEAESVARSFEDLKRAYEDNEYVKSQCHQLTHEIGKAAVKRYHDVAESYKYGDSFCWSGYHHGVMQEVVARLGYDNVKDRANEICASLKQDDDDRYSFDHYNCVHGLGHGFMGVQSNKLFDALETCDGLNDKWERESCYGGVFMENVMAFQSADTHTEYLKADDPMFPCTEVKETYKYQCYLMQTSHALVVVDQDYSKVFKLCSEATGFEATCYQSLGRDASGSTVSDAIATKDLCMLGPDDFAKRECITGAARDFVSYFRSDEQVAEFCDLLDTESLRLTCHDVANAYYQSL